MEKKSNFASKIMTNIKKILPYKGQHLQNLPENQFNSVVKYLDAKSLLTLKYSNKAIKNKIDKLNKDTKEYNTKEMLLKENYEKNLLRCAYIVLMYLRDSGGTNDLAQELVDYKTGETFGCLEFSYIPFEKVWDIDGNLMCRTLQDFAERFIRPKDETKCNYFIEELSTRCSWYCSENLEKFVKDMFAAAGFTENEIWDKAGMKDVADKCWNERHLRDSYNTDTDKAKKQIKSYQKVTGKSYEAIYNNLKNIYGPKKPEMENYIKTYEKLKTEEGSCNIF